MKIKKVLMILLCLFFLVGCTNVNNMSYEDIINIFNHNPKKANISRRGYKYYLPTSMESINRGDYYEIIKAKKNYYYLYVDMISYINELDNKYEIDNSASYSKIIQNGNKYGYLEINLLENEKYLIEIMYNYAKIEVMVNEDSINEALCYSVNILNSIEYNNNVINNLLSDDTLNYTEEEFNLFETGVDNSNKLEYIEQTEPIEEENEKLPDTDYVS